jgi:hypothetical protein
VADVAAAKLYADLGFTPTGEIDGDEIVVELRPDRSGPPVQDEW